MRRYANFDAAIQGLITNILEAKALASQQPTRGFHVECLDVAEATLRLLQYHDNELSRAIMRQEGG